MAVKKFICPPIPSTGAGTFSDDLVGFQLVQGGGLTQGNFDFVTKVDEKQNRRFATGFFSQPYNLESLGLDTVTKSKQIIETNFKVYPNFDLSEITNFTQFGSMVKRMSVSVQKIINYFPASLESTFMGINYSTGATAENITYNLSDDETGFDLIIERLRNPLEIDFTVNATRNLQLREIQVSNLRNLTTGATFYSLYYNDTEYKLNRIIPTDSLTNGILRIYVKGDPFSGQSLAFNEIVIRPNDYEVNRVFNEQFDEVEKFLLNRNVVPKYTADFNVPKEDDNGKYYTTTESLTWPLYGVWNLDIISASFDRYIEKLNEVSESFDLFRTNLVSRFLTTGAMKDFDTINQKVEKVLQIYGRSFDETNKFINALAYMNSVNYNVGNDIPSQLLKNLAQTLGWKINISPISEKDFLTSVFGESTSEKSKFSGVDIPPTPDELNYQYYRNIVLNAAYLFKSKGTRKAIEGLLRLIGAPESLVEFNEHVYLADQRINMSQFNEQIANISGGVLSQELPVLDPTYTFSYMGTQYTGFTTTTITQDALINRIEYPVDEEGYPTAPPETEDYFFQSGSGWFEQTPAHRASTVPNNTTSVFTGTNPNYQTVLAPYSYGQDYFNRFRRFPYMNLGFSLQLQRDNNKSWATTETNFRQNNDAGYIANYFTQDDRLVLNAKNIDLFLTPGQGLLYDIWDMSRQYNYPIPIEGLNYVPPTPCGGGNYDNIYPYPGGVDSTIISPQPQNKTFSEFSDTIMKNTINVRNRQTALGYPTLQSIFWKYIESQELNGTPNSNFNYKNMSEYVDGIGTYWVRLVEQMVGGSTIWNTGTKYSNITIHRQKHPWRPQRGCQLIPEPCNPCSFETNIYPNDCPTQSIECGIYPWQTNPKIVSFGNVLTVSIDNYLFSEGYSIGDCDLNSIITTWYVDLSIDGTSIIQYPFFNGSGQFIEGISYPSSTTWVSGLTDSLEELETFGYDYYFTDDDTVVVYSNNCSTDSDGINFQINVGINFNILCN
jgi:hypothetical protein